MEPTNSEVKKVKMNACRNATNSSSILMAVTPATLIKVTPQNAKKFAFFAMAMNPKITASTICPPNMFAKRRIPNTPALMNWLSTSIKAIKMTIGNTCHIGMPRCGMYVCK